MKICQYEELTYLLGYFVPHLVGEGNGQSLARGKTISANIQLLTQIFLSLVIGIVKVLRHYFLGSEKSLQKC